MEQITRHQAQRIAISASLNGRFKGHGKKASLSILRHLGYVQIDTISVIERAHHHIFWARQPGYKPHYLNQLLSVDKTVFEHWAHAVAYMPMEDYRFYLPKMEDYKRSPTEKWRIERLALAKPLFNPILKRIREEGPLASKDFDHAKKRTSGGWWNWKPAKLALEFLYLQGDLMVTGRHNFQRIYDLTERVLPAETDTTFPTSEEQAVFQINRSLQSMGIAREADMAKNLRVSSRKDLKMSLRHLVESDDVVQVLVNGQNDIYYSTPGILEQLEKIRNPRKVKILSPFDNLVIQRERLKRLFDFDYTIECYVPAPKRRYGYFVCPILWGNDLVARIDMKADRKSKKLLVNSLHYEDGFKVSKSFLESLNNLLEKFAVFNGCECVIRES